MKQRHMVFVTVESDASYALTPEIVKAQIQRFLVGHSILESLPYHGTSDIKVTHALDIDKLFNEYPS